MSKVSKKFVITGSNGFLGAAILRRSESFNMSPVQVFSEPSSDNYNLKTLDDPETINLICKLKPEVWIHSGWWGVAGKDRNDPRQLSINIPTTLRTVALAHSVGCKQWIGVGSQAEFGPQNRILSEEDPMLPSTTYGDAKRISCHLSKELCKELKLDWSWIRVFSLYGPGDADYWLIPSVINQLKNNLSPKLTPGEQLWDYLYIDDAADAVLEVAATQTKGDFNIGSGVPVKVRTIIERIREIMGSSASLDFGAIPYRDDQIMHLQADISKIMSETKWTPKTSLDTGLKNTIRHFTEAA